MSKSQILLALLCVVLLASGQILFKKSGMEIRELGTWFTLRNLFLLGTAFAIYISATFLWITLLKALPLSRAYVFMSLSFVIVPVASFFVFGETLSLAYVAGVSLIVIGILIASRAG